VQPDATVNETSVLRREVELLREQVRTLTADKDDLRAERDRLIGVLERNAEHMKLLADQREREHKRRSPSLFRWFRRAS
jgi:FtsZ-binding cell division protein ZapB